MKDDVVQQFLSSRVQAPDLSRTAGQSIWEEFPTGSGIRTHDTGNPVTAC